MEMAKSAFAAHHGGKDTCRQSRHFERGWRQAYYNVSKGADPCPPSVPPEVYWSTKYQNAEGSVKIAAWYDGYRQGAAAAQEACRSVFSNIPVVERCVRESSMQCAPVPALRGENLPPAELASNLDDESASKTADIDATPIDMMMDETTVTQTSYSPPVRLPALD